MEPSAEYFAALGEAADFLSHFDGLPDWRQAGKLTYPDEEVLLPSLLEVLAGAETFVDSASIWREIARSAAAVQAVSRRNDSHDHLSERPASLLALSRLHHGSAVRGGTNTRVGRPRMGASVVLTTC
jgi:hypothetical protein